MYKPTELLKLMTPTNSIAYCLYYTAPQKWSAYCWNGPMYQRHSSLLQHVTLCPM